MQITKILIADDHDIMFDGLINQCNAYFGACEIQTACSYAEAREILKTFTPDFLVSDIAMEEKDSGLLLCQDVVLCFPNSKIVLFTQYDNPYNVYQAYQLGIRVFLDKINLRNDFSKAIEAAEKGEKFHTERVKRMILNYFQKYNGSLPEGKIPKLTYLQDEYLKLFAQGKTDTEIAKIVSRSPNTVKKMRQNLYSIFQIEGDGRLKIGKLIAQARELGYVF